MDLQLSGKVAVVTGASKGIGLAITRVLADEGVRGSPASADLITACSNSPTRLRSTASGWTSALLSGHRGSLVTGRFTQPEEVADLVLFLASARAGNITGSDYLIDGGLITTL